MKKIDYIIFVLNYYFRKDKLLHSFIGNYLYMGILLFQVVLLKYPILYMSCISITITAGIAFSKEVYDYIFKDNHQPDINDFLYTVMPGIFLHIILLIKFG